METDNSADINSSVIFEELQLRRLVDEHGTITYLNKSGELHRILGPAVTYEHGATFWLQNHYYHRISGPAIERADGSYAWYINDREYTEESYWKELERINSSKSKTS